MSRPDWMTHVPARADALCVAGCIERHLKRSEWREAIEWAQDNGVPVDAAYLRNKWRLAENRSRAGVTPFRKREPVRDCPQPETDWKPAA